MDQEFRCRVASIPSHGLGLSVDVYAPNLFDLLDALEKRGFGYGYLELFKAPSQALARVKRRIPTALLEYHGDGVWLTQPDLETVYSLEAELAQAAAHLKTLGSYWMSHECATKQMAGYSFGTYLPPLFTRASAEVTARNVGQVQAFLDQIREGAHTSSPLLLVELPPLTYFGFGDLDIPDYFRLITKSAPCGLVLDMGHLWTIYRYSSEYARRPIEDFLAEFLERFPLERVVQIHVAGLGSASAANQGSSEVAPNSAGPYPPLWIDAHAAPVPDVLLDMLGEVLAHPNLTHLRGLALEVDTKPAEHILAEFQRFGDRFGPALVNTRRPPDANDPTGDDRGRARGPSGEVKPAGDADGSHLLRQYDEYVQAASGRTSLSAVELPSRHVHPEMLALYSQDYLPREILQWGGDLRHLFPDTCRRLEAHGISLAAFPDFWFRSPRPVRAPYDFFLLKLDRFIEFVQEVLPDARETAAGEAAEMRSAYHLANEQVGT